MGDVSGGFSWEVSCLLYDLLLYHISNFLGIFAVGLLPLGFTWIIRKVYKETMSTPKCSPPSNWSECMKSGAANSE